MKIIYFFVFFLVFTVNNQIFAQNSLNNRFFEILSKVESGGNKYAFNKKENAIGIYQIRKLYFLDARQNNTNLFKYSHEACYDSKVARMVVISYLNKYCKGGSMEDLARAHNSGPNWKKKKELTNKYWEKFQKEILTNK